ncbi:hypothetical protein [Clostridium sp.]|uniref:hypothetical protein n=1 Tax=Clostridium sp. TaxID=1506 RepID=UPI0026347B56|nr:hypothetical protein [Clostridium sp.]
MPKHTKLKVKVIKEIDESINSRKYTIGETIIVKTIKKESNYYHLELGYDVDMIPKDSVEVVNKNEG